MPEEKDIWQIFVRGIRGGTDIVRIHKDAKVNELINKISELNGIPPDTQRLLFACTQLVYDDTETKCLSDYKVKDHSNLTVVMRLKGGSDILEDLSPPPKQLDEDVETTEAPDMISWEDGPYTPRAKMSCGHAITPDTLTTFCESLLTAGKYVFKCPYIDPIEGKCRKEWPYLEVRRLAVLTADERKQFETKISDNYLRKGRGIQDCPKCHSFCGRINKKDKRVVCPLCSASDGVEFHFCWHCLHKWVGGGTETCGNDNCSGEDPRLKILRDCTKKTIVSVQDCPAVRACPKCGMLIEHEKDCKHMTCVCGQKFCFICLKKPDQYGSYQCGSYNSPCEIADVQKTIPADD
ncbi:UBB [Branchiostoma lanceolatum]|uniref:UBB protein n=1 Tax=Branchiostoma lanceolatum TaxID=7740 RepID=A0A8J9YZP9_BRALA|nr:UBB [Branchiostoma lanceolatum]